jgi:Ni,Fe-hydrogenase III small subunit
VGPLSSVIPVDLIIRGCPPTPLQLLAGLIALIETSAGRSPRS